jgi:hypothetical protein
VRFIGNLMSLKLFRAGEQAQGQYLITPLGANFNPRGLCPFVPIEEVDP